MDINKLILEFNNLISSRNSDKKGKKHLSEAQLRFLREIKKSNTTTITQIANQLNIKKPTATIAIQNLISDGYIEKVPSPEDKRSFIIKLSPLGEEIMQEIDENEKDLVDSLTSVLTKKEKLQFGWLLNKIVESNKI